MRNPDGNGEGPGIGPLRTGVPERKAPPSPPGKAPPREGNVGTVGKVALTGEGIVTASGAGGLGLIDGASPSGIVCKVPTPGA